jgi:HemK-related putative methylase
MAGLVYRPAEDSYLLLRHVKRLAKGLVLDMGTGSGIQAAGAASKSQVERVVAVDIDAEAIREADMGLRRAGLRGKVDLIISDLFSGLRPLGFNWIVFNPPYLPSEGMANEPSWAGGPRGGETIERFLSEASTYLKPEGGVLLVYSTLTEIKPKAFRGYEVEVLERLPLFFERLLCVLLRPRPS